MPMTLFAVYTSITPIVTSICIFSVADDFLEALATVLPTARRRLSTVDSYREVLLHF